MGTFEKEYKIWSAIVRADYKTYCPDNKRYTNTTFDRQEYKDKKRTKIQTKQHNWYMKNRDVIREKQKKQYQDKKGKWG